MSSRLVWATECEELGAKFVPWGRKEGHLVPTASLVMLSRETERNESASEAGFRQWLSEPPADVLLQAE